MNGTNRRGRKRLALVGAAVLCALAGAAVLRAVEPPVEALPPGRITSAAGEQQAYDSAMARLAGMLSMVQQADGLVAEQLISPVIAGLNQALDKLELARIALAGGNAPQAAADIAAAEGIMDGLEAPLAGLVARADEARRTGLWSTAGGIGVACTAVALLLLLKRRHDKKALGAFLAAEIDYGDGDSPAGSNPGHAEENLPGG